MDYVCTGQQQPFMWLWHAEQLLHCQQLS
eukprot:COSAG01_NODE_38636_length_487_cov_0.662371_2_plen_28_part_01